MRQVVGVILSDSFQPKSAQLPADNRSHVLDIRHVERRTKGIGAGEAGGTPSAAPALHPMHTVCTPIVCA